jgi:hypothetical protein
VAGEGGSDLHNRGWTGGRILFETAGDDALYFRVKAFDKL